MIINQQDSNTVDMTNEILARLNDAMQPPSEDFTHVSVHESNHTMWLCCQDGTQYTVSVRRLK